MLKPYIIACSAVQYLLCSVAAEINLELSRNHAYVSLITRTLVADYARMRERKVSSKRM
jgi:hypothetical protein